MASGRNVEAWVKQSAVVVVTVRIDDRIQAVVLRAMRGFQTCKGTGTDSTLKIHCKDSPCQCGTLVPTPALAWVGRSRDTVLTIVARSSAAVKDTGRDSSSSSIVQYNCSNNANLDPSRVLFYCRNAHSRLTEKPSKKSSRQWGKPVVAAKSTAACGWCFRVC